MAHYCQEKDGPALYADCQECEEQLCGSFWFVVKGGNENEIR